MSEKTPVGAIRDAMADEVWLFRVPEPDADVLYIVQGQWGPGEDEPWLKVGLAWYREEDAIRDAEHRTRNRPGVKFRVARAFPNQPPCAGVEGAA